MPFQEGLGSPERADFDEAESLALPVHFADDHWGLAVVDRAKQVVQCHEHPLSPVAVLPEGSMTVKISVIDSEN